MATNDAQPVTLPVDAQTATDLYRRMLLIRGFEDRVQSLFLRGEVYGTTHLYSGQEAVAIGFADVLDYDFVGLDRASALQRFLAGKASRIGRPLRLRVQLRSFDAICRLVECNVGVGIVPETTVRRTERTMAIKSVRLTDSWAPRELTICVRDVESLPPYARQLVDHLRAGA